MAPKEMRRLIASRDAIISRLAFMTEQMNQLDVINEQSFKILSSRREHIQESLIRFNQIMDELEELGESDPRLHLETCDSFHTLLAQAEQKLDIYNRENLPIEREASPIHDFHAQMPMQSTFRLPEIPIPTFSGQFSEWLHFRDTFSNIIINNPTITDAIKFYYLRQSLSGEALARIHNIPPGDNNFHIAWKLLTERYDNTRLIAASYISGLKTPPSVTINSAPSLRNFIDHFKSNINALEALNLGVDIKDLLYSHEILSHLDVSTRREWEQRSSVDNIPNIASLWNFLENRCRIWEMLSAEAGSSKPNSTNYNNQCHKRTSLPHNTQINRSPPRPNNFNSPTCSNCKGNHATFKCISYTKLQPSERLALVKRNYWCFNCLQPNVHNHKCSPMGCHECQKRHHTSLHQAFSQTVTWNKPTVQNTSNLVRASNFKSPNKHFHTNSYNSLNQGQVPSTSIGKSDTVHNHPAASLPNLSNDNNGIDNSPTPPNVTVNTCSASVSATNKCLLPTAEVYIQNSDGSYLKCTALLDSGSDCNLISNNLVEKLKLAPVPNSILVQGICNAGSISSNVINVNLKSVNSKWNSVQRCIVVSQITSNLPTTDIDLNSFKIPENIQLADSNFHISKPIELLLGAGVFASIVVPGHFPNGNNLPAFLNSKLGWIVVGSIPETSTSQTKFISNFVSSTNVCDQLEKFWAVEEIAVKPAFTLNEKFVEDNFVNTTFRTDEGRYCVSLPRKSSITELGHSRSLTLKRFHSLETRLARNPALKELYCNFMNEYEELGHMKIATDPPCNSTFYIPHHPVFKPDSTTTKLRVVFDASAKTSTQISLNDCLHVGPTIQSDLFDILMRFRSRPFAFAADITKMYRQVLVDHKDWDLQRIFWRPSPELPISEYQLLTVTYGTAPAAFLATRTLHQLALDEASHLPEVFNAITSDFYVDDLLSGAVTELQASTLANDIFKTLLKGGFELRKWVSNSELVLASIPAEFHETRTAVPVIDKTHDTAKTLGLLWDSSVDELFISADLSSFISKTSFTKREFLSATASIFDPLGLISPVVVLPKIMFQRLWLAKIDWDDNLPSDLLTQWLNILSQLPTIATISIPRCVFPLSGCEDIHIHGFCDASSQAYGACIYLRALSASGEASSRLLCAKSRVAPLKLISISRLELCAALLLSRLVVKVISALSCKISEVHLWTDSSNVRAWLMAPPDRKNVFVSLRVSEIQQSTRDFNWRHVVSSENPADLITRGVPPSALHSNSLWWNGPSWLSLEPIPNLQSKNSNFSLFTTSEAIALTTICSEPSFTSVIISRYSLFSKMLRVTAYCIRFIFNMRNKSSRQIGPLTASDLDQAELILAKEVQSQVFTAEFKDLQNHNEVSFKSSLLPFSPFLHIDGLIRVGGRLARANLPFDVKHQILLPSRHKFTRALIVASHQRLLHAGVQSVMADLRQKFWFPSTRRTVRNVLHSCIPCFKFQPSNTLQQQMGQLPSSRILPQPPFLNCGIDYAGPMSVIYGGPRSKCRSKAYLALFVCMVTRAVHCEIVSDLTTQAFLSALKRFIARRGVPKCIYSDNSTTFQGAKSELSNLFEFILNSNTRQDIQNYCNGLRITWSFIPPRTPHFGGLWEAAVKSFKRIFRVVASHSALMLDELFTISAQVEAILNSRPIVALTEDSQDLNYLSPGHFLIGRPLAAIPNNDFDTTAINSLTRWKRIQVFMSQIWNHWSSEYLLSLQRLQKWRTSSDNVKSGLIVLLKEDNLPLGSWRLGRIIDVFPGIDGKVRVVSVRTQQGIYKRNISRLVPLPISD